MGHLPSKKSLKSKPNKNNQSSYKNLSSTSTTTLKKHGSFRFIDGRRYHNDENSVYFLPNDDEEVDRLQLQHFLFRFVWQDNFSSPIKDLIEQGDAKVLDVGCGPGTWLLEMSTDFPRSSFTGVDMSPIYPSDIKPPNVKFYTANILQGLPFADNTFDFVYMRFLIVAFAEEDWENKVINELVRVCKPGGWVEFMESDLVFNPEGPAGKKLMDAFRSTLESKKINPMITKYLYSILASTQTLTCLTSEQKPCPIGNWAGKVGELSCQDFSQTLHSLKPMLCKAMNCTVEEYNDLVVEFGNECNSNKANLIHFRFFAKKVDE